MPMPFEVTKGLLNVLLLLIGLATMGYLVFHHNNGWNDPEEFSILWAPLLSALVVLGLTFGTIYVDNLNAGAPMPTPIPPLQLLNEARMESFNDSANNGGAHQQLCYVGAIASGAVVFLIMYVNL